MTPRKPHWRVVPHTGGAALRCDKHPHASAFAPSSGCEACWRQALVAAKYVVGEAWSYCPVRAKETRR